MGEIADDMIEGRCCAVCGQYFEEPRGEFLNEGEEPEIYEHGYPVACKECWEPDCGYQKATADTL